MKIEVKQFIPNSNDSSIKYDAELHFIKGEHKALITKNGITLFELSMPRDANKNNSWSDQKFNDFLYFLKQTLNLK